MANTNDLPSAETLRLIDDAGTAAVDAEAMSARFVYRTALALQAFDGEVNPLHLPDEDYESVVRASGLHALLATATKITTLLSALAQDRAA